MRDDEDRPRGSVTHQIGQSLDTLSLSDLDARIALLRAEIVRIEAARAAKQAAQGAADAFFKRS
ncbi:MULTISPECIES: DUF1192 domain-containing protein [Methylobacterium]|jgi:uncharacterized small protein (DUF1192 family)|uniref:DUF1192 domain-containing protein n=1 Tax=Methylobacterium longum TaxID=767694 RepID=A0ABT8AV93_9HYPH|nr:MULTISPECIES: DUF1192 domain-containing protein [Methylobacterium]MCJ2100610.1 DUF1192 domain-containing protein [Methylobacterium sp. E-046]MDN3573709.1 DUF1192 domain-containing protein [Methylobacterium longum]GJE11202.1 hypothetical protein FOHLNKBM_2243 [Methylobacterium longum]